MLPKHWRLFKKFWTKYLTMIPPQKTLFLIVSHTSFCFRRYTNLFNTVLITNLCNDMKWRTQMKILTVVGCGECGQIFLFNFAVFSNFYRIHSMLMMVTLHTKLYYQATITRSMGKTSRYFTVITQEILEQLSWIHVLTQL